MKPDPIRLDPASYTTLINVPPRASDIDSLRHINNVAIAAIYDEGRASMMQKVFAVFTDANRPRIVTAQVNISYLGEGFYPDMLQVAGGISRIGTSSFGLAQGLFQNGRCIGVCDSVFVCTGQSGGQPMGEDLIAKLRPLLMAGV